MRLRDSYAVLFGVFSHTVIANTFTNMHVFVRIYTHTSMYTRTYMHTYIHKHAHTHTHTHTCSHPPAQETTGDDCTPSHPAPPIHGNTIHVSVLCTQKHRMETMTDVWILEQFGDVEERIRGLHR